MNKRIIAIVGSYRKEGVIDQAVDALLAAAKNKGAQTQKIALTEQHIEFCANCRNCTQRPGAERGQCIHNDDMEQILNALDCADAIVLASPMNFGQVTALTKRFIERLTPYGSWPWGTAAPRLRKKEKTKCAVIITSSAMPGIMARWLTGIRATMKQAVETAGARLCGTLFIGMVGVQQKETLPERARRKAERLADKLI